MMSAVRASSSSGIAESCAAWIDAGQEPDTQALGDAMLGDDMIHAGAAAGGAYQFPEAASLRISFSSVRSETPRATACSLSPASLAA